uniref:STI1/HOP DP domain-containing protein n=1 Tax=Rhodnius prolixus TaxID=13249 RepID=T1HBT5_RHOPR
MTTVRDYAEAVKFYTEAIKRNPDDAKYYSNRAACYTKLAAFDLGLKDCDTCLQLDPKFIKGWIRKGKILQGMQQPSKAISAYQRALDIDPTNAEALEGYKQCSIVVNSNPEEVRKRAMADPEVQSILCDPAMRLILEQMQNDPKALQEANFVLDSSIHLSHAVPLVKAIVKGLKIQKASRVIAESRFKRKILEDIWEEGIIVKCEYLKYEGPNIITYCSTVEIAGAISFEYEKNLVS